MNFKKLLCLLLALTMVVSMAACKGNGDGDEDQLSDGEPATHTVTVKSAGGMALAELGIYVYDANDMSDLKAYAETDEDGNAAMELTKGDDYAIVISGAPEGYAVEETYSFDGTTAAISLTSSLIKDKDISGAELGLGDVMYDFTVTAADGSTVTLSEMLAEKDMVLLNFWFSTCGPCASEFPYMEEAYQMYKDSVGIIALSHLDNLEAVKAYQNSMALTFPMGSCSAAWPTAFGTDAFPTSVVIDRYGVICLMEQGALTSLTPFTSIFEHFSGDDYAQKLCTGGVADVVTQMKPTTTMPSSEEIAAVINNGDIPVTYLNAGETDLEYNWPFIIGKQGDTDCITSSNQEIESSYSIIRMEIELTKGQALGFDYIISSESGNDVFITLVNEDANQSMRISGYDETPKWQTLYPCVAEADGTYTVSLCYLKDDSDNAGTDTVYIKNVHIIDSADIATPTYLYRHAATSEDGFEYSYVATVYNESDGYYHVGTKDGPLLLANLMNTSLFNEETYIWNLVYEKGLTIDGTDYTNDIQDYCTYASNSDFSGYCTVNKELYKLMGYVDALYGFDAEDDMEWMKACAYYEAYGTNGEQKEDPIAGLAPFCAFTAKEGKNISTNYFYYNRMIMPRGMLAEFIPTKSGVYRITSRCDSSTAPNGWIFDENHTELYSHEPDERMFTDDTEMTMVYYMEAGTAYYIDIAFWDVYETGRIDYDIEYIAASYDHFRLASLGFFTYDTNATGDAMYHTIAGGINVVLGDDGYYYHDMGDGNKGSKLYCDFTGTTGILNYPFVTEGSIKGMIDLGAFDFSKNEYDMDILVYLEKNDGDVDATREELKTVWGDDYETNVELYQLEEVLEGKYHGKGEDYTEKMRAYEKKIITTGDTKAQGCVLVDEELAEILQLLMDKYFFEGVDHSWTKLCYYYDHMG